MGLPAIIWAQAVFLFEYFMIDSSRDSKLSLVAQIAWKPIKRRVDRILRVMDGILKAVRENGPEV